MIHERITELIHSGLDGELGKSERSELDLILQSSAEARDYLEELESLSDLLGQEDVLDLPDGLHREIVASVQLPAKTGFSFKDVPAFIRFALAAAAGLVMTVGVYESQLDGPGGAELGTDVNSMVGTIMHKERAEVEGTLDMLTFDLEKISSTVRLQRTDGQLVLDILLDAKDPVDITAHLTSDGLLFDSVTQTQSELKSIELTDQAIQFKGQGRHHFAVLLHRNRDLADNLKASIDLRFTSNGELIKEGSLVTKEVF